MDGYMWGLPFRQHWYGFYSTVFNLTGCICTEWVYADYVCIGFDCSSGSFPTVAI
jgi:hypothetical protein